MTSSYPFTPDDLETLRQWDTPTICNGLEEIVPERRAIGFTVEPMAVLHPDPEAPPIIGLARTGTVRAKEPPRGPVANRLDWYEYVADASLPTVVVLQDLDDRPGYGAFWGEVNTNIHMRLGAVGCVTNGSFRDLGEEFPDRRRARRTEPRTHPRGRLRRAGQRVRHAGCP